MPRLLLVALACALFAAPGLVRADELAEVEDLPWWAQADYPEEPDVAAAAGPAELPAPVDTTWWAGGPDAILALSGDQPPAAPEPSAGSVEEPAPFWAEPPAAPSDGQGDDGRNPHFGGRDGNRAEGHRAGEEPAVAGESEPSEGTTEALPGEDAIQVEERDRRDPNQCNRYAKQIVRYRDEIEFARDNGREPAADALEAHVERIQAKWDAKCAPPPGPSNLEKTIVFLAKAAKLAAKVARLMYGSPF